MYKSMILQEDNIDDSSRFLENSLFNQYIVKKENNSDKNLSETHFESIKHKLKLLEGDSKIIGGLSYGIPTKNLDLTIKTGEHNPLKNINLKPNECINDDDNDGICLSDIIPAIKQFIVKKMNTKPVGKPHELLEVVKEELNCKSESCVISSSEFSNFVSEHNIMTPQFLKQALITEFKPKGHRNSGAWLDNFNIDESLAIWAREDFQDFYPFSMNMIDFEVYGGSLVRVDLQDILNGKVPVAQGPGHEPIIRPCKRMGCVLNTDVHTGTGKHWICIFIDCSSKDNMWTVEYFNSSGNFPDPSVVRYLYHAKKRLLDYQEKNGLTIGVEVIESVAINQIQKSNSECGLYCLFYIRSRLEGKTYDYFRKNNVQDKFMVEFRKYLFRSED